MNFELPAGWEIKLLGDVLTLQRGFDITRARQRSGDVPVVSSGGVSSYHDTAAAAGPGVVIGRKGTLGKVFYLPGDYWPHDTTLWVKDFHGNDPRFAYYFFKTLDVLRLDVGSANPTLNRNHVHQLRVSWPPFTEQKRIAAVLGALDDKIESDWRLAALLEEAAATTFRARFVDFVGESHFVDTELGHLPEEWAVAPIGDVLKVVGGGTPSTKESRYWEGGTHCWATPKDLAGARSAVLLDTARHITDEGVRRISSGLLPERTVLLSSRAPVGYTAMSMVQVAVNQGFIAIPPSDSVPSEYVLLWLRENVARIKAHAGGTTFAEISKRAFRPLLLPVPPASVLAEFEQETRPMFDLVAGQEREIDALSKIRDTLIPKLVSGEIRVPDTGDPAEAIGALAQEVPA